MYYIKLISLIVSLVFIFGTVLMIFKVLKLKKAKNPCLESKERVLKTIEKHLKPNLIDADNVQKKLILIQAFDCFITHAKKIGFRGSIAQEILNNILPKYVSNIEKIKEDYLFLIESVSSDNQISNQEAEEIIQEIETALKDLYDI